MPPFWEPARDGPNSHLLPHRDTERRGLKIGDWPSADQALWHAALVPGGPLDDPGRAALWSLATRRKVAGSYGRYLGWLQRRGRLDLTTSARMLLNEGWVGAYLTDPAQAVASSTVLNRAADLRLFANAVLPMVDWDWLGRLETAVRQRARPLRDQRLGLRSVADLVALGERLMTEEASSAATELQAQLAWRDGLMIAVLPLAPLRLKNFAALELGRSLIRRGEFWWIAVPGEETKNGRPYERPFPERLLSALGHYLDQVRPALAGRRGRWARPVGQALGFGPWLADGRGRGLSADRAAHGQRVRHAGEPASVPPRAATSIALAAPRRSAGDGDPGPQPASPPPSGTTISRVR